MVHDIIEKIHLLRVLHHLLRCGCEGLRRIFEIKRHHIPVSVAKSLQVKGIGAEGVEVALELIGLFITYGLLECCCFIARFQVRLRRVTVFRA